jgi:hypothetical protein
MAGELPPNVGEGPATGPPADAWMPSYPTRPTPPSRNGRAIGVTALALAALALLLAVTGLIMTIAQSRHSAPSTSSSVRTFTAAETSAAQRQLCGTYKLVAQAAQVDTAGTDKSLARIATTNGALMLDMAAANPALDAPHREAALALATAYGTLTAKGTYGVASDAEYKAALDDALAKDAEMKRVCGGS